MTPELTLPGLQSTLDSLSEGQQVTLARTQADRLFGLNDVGSTRMARFAVGHHCIVVHADSCVVFEKRS
jgi:hypothetical protein